MATPQNNNNPLVKRDEQEIKWLFSRYKGYLWLYPAALLLALGIAKYYNWYATPVYAIAAKVLVRDDNSATDKLLQQISIEKPLKNMENEIEILRSYNLLSKVLNELEFDVSYCLVGDVKKSEVYKDCPFRVSADKLQYPAYFIEFFIELLDSESFGVTFKYNNNVTTLTGRFEEPFDTGLGTITLSMRETFPHMELLNPDFGKRKYSIKFNTLGHNQNKYLSRLSIGMARPQSTILTVYLEDEVPQKGLDFVNKLIEVYLDNDVDEKNKAASATADFLDSQLASITQDLEAIETNRERYKVDKGIIDLQSESQLALESIREADGQKGVNNARLSLINQLEKYVSENQDLRDLAPAALDITDPLLIKLIGKLSELQSQREIIVNRSTANDPSLIPLNAEIELTRNSLLENVRNIRKGLLKKESEINEAIQVYRRRIQRIPTTEKELLEIERRFRIQESLYLFLLQRRAELSITLAATKSDTRLIDSARLLPGPIRPVPGKAYAVAVLLALLVPTLFAITREQIDDRVKELSMVKRLTDMPIIGAIRWSKGEEPLISLHSPRSALAEDFRSLRTSLGFMKSSQQSEVIMVTSTVGAEGKTFTSTNLAAIFAAAGHRTVLVGLDLRKPRILDSFDIPHNIGCSNYLSGSATIHEITHPSGIHKNLWVIPAGALPPNPAELIASPRMGSMIEALREQYDKIILDTPPVGLVSDAFLLNAFVHTTAYIVREGYTRRAHLRNLHEMYASGRLQNPGIVYNAAALNSMKYGYAGSYSSSYGYGAYFDEASEGRRASKKAPRA